LVSLGCTYVVAVVRVVHAGSCCLSSGRVFSFCVLFLFKFCLRLLLWLFFDNVMIIVWVLISFAEFLYVEFSCVVHVFLFALDVQHVHRVFHCVMCMVCLQYILYLGSWALCHSLVRYVLLCWQLMSASSLNVEHLLFLPEPGHL